jgi:hypothetical protein
MSDSIVASDVRLERDDRGIVLSCRVRGAADPVPSTLWLRLPEDASSGASPLGDPFLAVLVPAAMSQRKRLVIEADVSADLLHGCVQVMRVYKTWSDRRGDGLTPVDVEAPGTPSRREGTRSGAFFSGGVDSFYTVLRNEQRHSAGDAGRITELLLVHGFDIALDREELFETTCRHLRAAADALDKRLTVVRTNVRAAVRGVDWVRYGHGPVLAAVGLALSRRFRTLHVAAGRPFTRLEWIASHPGLLPWWSTAAIDFVYDGGEADRLEKVRFIARSPVALRFLRVCWENRDGAYNCGRCEKCLRTMVELEACGALSAAEQFPRRVDPAAIQALALPRHLWDYWSELLPELEGGRPDAAELAAAIKTRLAREVWLTSWLGGLDSRVSKVLSRVGLSARRVKAIDQSLLGGRGLALFQSVRGRARPR